MDMKRCTKCGVEYEASVEFFNRCKRNKCGLAPKCKVCCKKYNEDHAEQRRKYNKQWYKDNKEQHKARGRQRDKNNPGKRNGYSRRWKKNNSEHCNEYSKQWAKDNPDKRSVNEAKRRARKLEQTPNLTQLEQDRVHFIYKVCSTMDGYHVDHIKPLSKGGLHEPDNLQILSAPLNMQKSDKWPLTKEEQIKYKGLQL